MHSLYTSYPFLFFFFSLLSGLPICFQIYKFNLLGRDRKNIHVFVWEIVRLPCSYSRLPCMLKCFAHSKPYVVWPRKKLLSIIFQSMSMLRYYQQCTKPHCCLCKIAMRAVDGSNHKQVIKCASTAFQATVSASYRRTVITSDHLGEKHCRRPDNYVYTY